MNDSENYSIENYRNLLTRSFSAKLL